ncbi:hypothetical protein REPUB_Repub04eG0211000 [Reevesia pubescens]
MRNQDRIWAQIRYEKLSEFYFSYGKLGHLQKACEFGIIKTSSNVTTSNFGPHVRAALHRYSTGSNSGRDS